MPDVAVVVPWRPDGCAHRQRAWAWLQPRYTWPTIEAAAPAGPWVKARAVMPAVERAGAEIVIVADADVWTDGLQEAVDAVDAGAAWAIPHGDVHRLTQAGTEQLLAGAPWETLPLEQPAYHGIPGGGIVIAHRDVLLNVPLDPRFVGWGQEDESWAMALHGTVGPPWRGTRPLVHLWHPPQQRLSRRRGSVEGWQLRRRYIRARNQPDQLRQLLTEARLALTADQPAVHDHPPRHLV